MPNFSGTADPDTWFGSGDNETAHGGAGNDDLHGGGGGDTLYGEGDDDTLNGDDGNDTIWGGAGLDHLFGGSGDDVFWAYAAELAAGEDYHGGSGNDTVLISTGASAIDLTGIVLDGIETLQAGALLESGMPGLSVTMTPGQLNGLDTLNIGSGTLVISAAGTVDFTGGRMHLLSINLNAGGNTLNLSGVTVFNYSPPAGPYINGSAVSDTVFGSDNHDVIYGNDGNDILDGGKFGSDLLDGGGGDDRLKFNPGSGSDAFYGGVGSDTFDAGNAAAAVTVTLGVNAGDMGFGPANSQLRDIENIDGSAFNDTLTGSDAANVLDGKAGNDVINGRLGADTLLGGAGNDIFNFTSVMITSQTPPVGHIDGGADYDILDLRSVSPVTVGMVEGELGMYVGSQRFTIAGVELILLGADDHMAFLPTKEAQPLEIRAGGGNDYLSGGGAYLIYGEAGDDRIFVSGTFGGGTSGLVHGGAGIDTLATNIGFTVDLAAGTASAFAASYALAGIENVELSTNGYTSTARGDANANRLSVSTLLDDGSVGVLLEGRAGDDILIGSAGSDTLDGGNDDDFLDGGTGADHMAGGSGDDVYVVDDAGEAVVELQGDGLDEIRTGLASYSLIGREVENLTGTAAGAQRLTGNAGANIVTGGAGNDTLDGGAGADTMAGSLGGDSYFVDNVGDVVIEHANEGYDIVYSGVSYALGADSFVEVLATIDNTATTPINLTGNALANYLVGNAGANLLDGGAGPDQLWGRGGDDSYYADAGDDVVEYAGDGYDIVYARSSYGLGVGQSIEVLATIDNTATTAINLIGNALSNYIVGNAGSNTLNGGGGDDQLWGREGDDSYIADMNDIVLEYAGQGSDILYATASYILAAGLSIEALATADNTATTAINLTGNELDNYVTGNAGANTLDGGTGSDLLWGRGGDDSYFADSNDVVREDAGQGNDIIYARGSFVLGAGVSVEILATVDNTATTAISLTGNELDNYIVGNAGANTLDGGTGSDTLWGREGDDSYFADGNDLVIEYAGQGNDVVYARGSFTLAAGMAIEELRTANENATTALDLTGNELGQLIYGNAGANVLNGGLGSDGLVGGFGADTYLFNSALGAGNVDTIDFWRGDGDRIVLDHNIFTALGVGALAPNAFAESPDQITADTRIYHGGLGFYYYDADGSGSGQAVLFLNSLAMTALAAQDFTVI